MRLTILPGSLWVAYQMRNVARVNTLLPPHLHSTPVSLFEGDRKECKLLFNAFRVSSTWMQGTRVEVQTMARDSRSGSVHLVVLDCVSDVHRWDPTSGVSPSNSKPSHVDFDGDELHFCIEQLFPSSQLFRVQGNLSPVSTLPNRQFAVDANRACYFGNDPIPLPMTFSEQEIMHPVRKLVRPRITNELWPSYRSQRPSAAFVHPRHMRFRVQVPGMWYDVW